MRYMVAVSKHHDGFAMFHSAIDPYNIYDATPFHRDVLSELAALAGGRASASAFTLAGSRLA